VTCNTAAGISFAPKVSASIAGWSARLKGWRLKMRNAENTSDIRPLTDVELEQVNGGVFWEFCELMYDLFIPHTVPPSGSAAWDEMFSP
jgi:hypothetical protein